MGRNDTIFWSTGTIAAVILAAVGWLWTAHRDEQGAPQGVIVINQTSQPSISPTPGRLPRTLPVRSEPDETNLPFLPTPDILSALSLPAEAVFRDVVRVDKGDAVICGTVGRSQADNNFRRFVYIGSAKTGFVDDGGKLFAQINAASCKAPE